MIDPKKQARIDEVKALLADFSKQHFRGINGARLC